jgi:hypothetical protein
VGARRNTPPASVEIDLRVGGRYHLDMDRRSPTGMREGGGATQLSLTDGPYRASGHAEQGWEESFNKLGALLRSTRPRALGAELTGLCAGASFGVG